MDKVEINNVTLTRVFFQCPKCLSHKDASAFGFRRMGDGTIRNQSYCIACRSRKKSKQA